MERRFAAPGTHLCGLAWDGTRLWHSDGAAAIYALDPGNGDVLVKLACPQVRTGLTWTGEVLIQVVDTPKRLCRLRPTGDIVGYQTLAPGSDRCCGIEADGDRLWLGLDRPGAIQLVELDTLRVVREFAVEGEVAGLTHAPGVVLYADYHDRMIRSIDPESGELVGRLPVAGAPTGLTWADSLLWYCDFESHEICAVTPDGLLR